jgi:hypothetical protein
MWSQQKRLALLNEELRSIEKLERLRAYAGEPERYDQAREAREERRAEILAEIARLQAAEPWFEVHAKGLSVALLLCAATLYATIHLFFR